MADPAEKVLPLSLDPARISLMGVRLSLLVGLAATAASLACQAGQAPGAEARPLRVASYNIHHGSGNEACAPPPPTVPPAPDCALNLERIAGVVRGLGADVVGLQEVDRFWARSGYVDQPAALASILGMSVCYGANLDHAPDTHSSMPHQYGTAILSRAPILECTNRLLPRASAANEQRGLLLAVIDISGVPLEFFDTHLHTTTADRALQVPAIEQLIGAGARAILVGDLNARSSEPAMALLFERLRDAWQVARPTAPGDTFPASPTALADRRIDYIFTSRDVRIDDAAVAVDGTTIVASDHFPLHADVALPGTTSGSGRR